MSFFRLQSLLTSGYFYTMLIENTSKKEEFYRALVSKDASYEGIFIAPVTSTGIFCRPTCTARKPKPENVIYFESASLALKAGFRPCKICKPLEIIKSTPDAIQKLLTQIESDPSHVIKSYELRQSGLDPATIRRWFQKHHGITFTSYQRLFRINHAFKNITQGHTVIQAAYDSGYESVSGFHDSYKSIFGMAPSQSKDQQPVNLKRIESPLGTLLICAVAEGICLLEFSDRPKLETELKELGKFFNGPVIQGSNKHFDVLEKQLHEYFKGARKTFDIPLVTPGSEFQQQVWRQLQTIAYGTTRSYKEQAAALSQPKAIRAIATANGMNRIAIVIPCHRVIGSDGSMTGYGGGIWRKKWLLDHESTNKQLSLL